jgi:hypothetical protein
LDQHVPTIKSSAIAGNVLPLKEIDYRTQVFDNRALLGFALRLESPALLAVNDLSRGRERRAQTLVQADTIGFNVWCRMKRISRWNGEATAAFRAEGVRLRVEQEVEANYLSLPSLA